MKSNLFTFLIFSCVLFLNSCAKVYHVPNISTIVQEQKEIAIITPQVIMDKRATISENTIDEQQFSEAIYLQFEMYDWMLKRQRKGQFVADIQIQDVVKTNETLEAAGFFDGQAYTNKEVCELLGVDAILFSTYTLDVPFDVGTVATAVLLDDWNPHQRTTVDLSIYDNKEQELIWNYKNKLRTTVSNPDQFVTSFMQNASKKMPYFLEKN